MKPLTWADGVEEIACGGDRVGAVVDHVFDDVFDRRPPLGVIEDRALLVDHGVELRIAEAGEVLAGAGAVAAEEPGIRIGIPGEMP